MKKRQQQAFEIERKRWKELGLDSFITEQDATAPSEGDDTCPEGTRAVYAPVTGTVWKIEVENGRRVEAGDVLMILESMKMETAIAAPHAGTIRELRCQSGRVVKAGQIVATIEDSP
jgi:urea carboxylase